VAGGLLLGIRIRFHKYAPQQLAAFLTFHQQAADEFGGNLLGWAGEEGFGGSAVKVLVAMEVALGIQD